MTFGVHCYDKQGREVTGTQFYKTACEERDVQIAALQEQVQKLAALAEERRVFIVNGAEMGYIQLPVFEDDPATATYQRCLLNPKYATDAFIRDIKSKAELEGMVKGAGRVALEASKVYRAAPQNSDERSLHKVIGNFAHKVARIIREGEQS